MCRAVLQVSLKVYCIYVVALTYGVAKCTPIRKYAV